MGVQPARKKSAEHLIDQVLAQRENSSTVRRLEILADNATRRPMEGESGRGRSALLRYRRMLQAVNVFISLLSNRDNFCEIFEIERLDIFACSRGITVRPGKTDAVKRPFLTIDRDIPRKNARRHVVQNKDLDRAISLICFCRSRSLLLFVIHNKLRKKLKRDHTKYAPPSTKNSPKTVTSNKGPGRELC